MKQLAKHVFAAIGLSSALFAAQASAQEITIGLGYSEFSRPGAENGELLSFEYLHTPFYERDQFSAGWGGAIDVQGTGDVFLGGGVYGRLDLRNRWFLDGSIMPGVFIENVELNDLGSTFEIRSQFGVGRQLRNGSALSLAISHKSNASTADINPGVNTLLLRWHKPL